MVSEGFLKWAFVRATVVAKSAFSPEHLFVSLSVAELYLAVSLSPAVAEASLSRSEFATRENT